MIKRNIRKYKIMEKQVEFTRHGMYYEAKVLLRLLQNGHVLWDLVIPHTTRKYFWKALGALCLMGGLIQLQHSGFNAAAAEDTHRITTGGF